MTGSRLPGRLAAAAASVALVAGILLPLSAAHAAAGVVVTNAQGAAAADPDYATEMTVRGSGFQSIANGFGGVYVLFGWVDDPSGTSWTPSSGGLVGTDFRYVPDSESQDNQGFQRFVAFPGSETEGAAHAVMAADGSWTVSMVVPGAVFESRDRSGNNSSVDCREVTCGIITIGAHGVKNANNETFTPITFAAAGTGAAGTTDAAAAATGTEAAPAIGALRLGLASTSVDAGTSVAFTGQGFTPGEQVVATLDNGLVSVGPLAAGAQGEVAGVLPVPRDVRGGTHLVTLTGAASGGTAEAQVTIVVSDTLIATPATQATPMWLFVVLASSIVLALVLIVTSVIVSIRRAARRGRAARRVKSASAAPIAAGAEKEAATDPTSATGIDEIAGPAAAPGAATTVSPVAPGAPVARAGAEASGPDSETLALSLPGAER